MNEQAGCECKVGRGIDAYGLGDANAELRRRWLGEDREQQGLRDLATYFNRRILRAAMERADRAPFDSEVRNTHRLLTDEDVSSGARTQTHRRLAAAGVPVDAVLDAFVSHQTIHGHLTDCVGVSRSTGAEETDPAARRRSDRERIRALQSRTEVVTTDALERLRDADALALMEFDVLADVTVLCGDCGRHHDIGTLLDRGGCDCQRD